MTRLLIEVETEPVATLGRRLGFATPFERPANSYRKPLPEWKMEEDDAPILRYLYRERRPCRHLEFGTWRGSGVVACLESCAATVWTLNLPEGEVGPDGRWAYAENWSRSIPLPPGARTSPLDEDRHTVRTDSGGFVGREYLSRGLGHRVCQILCDSRDWDITNYPPGFFDSCLIDGGHTRGVVQNDLGKALTLLRPGGLLMLHDFCPVDEVYSACPSTVGVLAAVHREMPTLRRNLSDLFWIDPSWLLIGVRR